MGSGMAANLLDAGHEVVVYNRTAAKSEVLARKGATVAASIAEACRTGVVFTMLSDDKAAQDVVDGDDGVLANLPGGGMHVSSSTISVDMSRRLASDHADAGQRYVAAPVFGRPDAAAAGKLFVVAAGAKEALDAAAPAFEAVGQRTFTVSEIPEAANLIKLSGNFLILSVIESLGEAMALVGKAGVDRRQYLEILTSTLFGAPVYKTYGELIAEEKFEPAGFAAPLGQKDIRLALAAAEELNVPLPVASLLRDRFLRLMAHGGQSLDWSAIAGLSFEDSGE
jgi:3-hydroxyisobutyrate dehydrogenase-like beta-hydroxyacid dehydrogenase